MGDVRCLQEAFTAHYHESHFMQNPPPDKYTTYDMCALSVLCFIKILLGL